MVDSALAKLRGNGDPRVRPVERFTGDRALKHRCEVSGDVLLQEWLTEAREHIKEKRRADPTIPPALITIMQPYSTWLATQPPTIILHQGEGNIATPLLNVDLSSSIVFPYGISSPSSYVDMGFSPSPLSPLTGGPSSSEHEVVDLSHHPLNINVPSSHTPGFVYPHSPSSLLSSSSFTMSQQTHHHIDTAGPCMHTSPPRASDEDEIDINLAQLLGSIEEQDLMRRVRGAEEEFLLRHRWECGGGGACGPLSVYACLVHEMRTKRNGMMGHMTYEQMRAAVNRKGNCATGATHWWTDRDLQHASDVLCCRIFVWDSRVLPPNSRVTMIEPSSYDTTGQSETE
eukprot:TRINITY_DN6326_c1_g2_i1.p1 TRINITY_DN6326_c1_g2~~TRINITY_DN6326_c1_g2_i1.p1  ORF type:complete len:343 (-),score=32.53 TRINITY_DN6326_c1_g2_i1:226-1254(-)